jgi:hypothetical protein
MQIPDLEGAYSISTAAYDYTQSIIEKAAETGEIEFLNITNLNLLNAETCRWIQRLAADEANKKYIDNLKKLLAEVEKALQAVEVKPPAPPSNMGASLPGPAPVEAGSPMGV